MKVIVAHSGWQHSAHLALALQKAGMLDVYVTTVCDHPRSFLVRLLKRTGPKSFADGMKTRSLDGLDASKVKMTCLLSGLVSILCARKKWTRLYELNERQLNWRFGRKVARMVERRKADVVVMYEGKAAGAFSYLKKRGVRVVKVVDSASACALYVEGYMREEYRRASDGSTFFEPLNGGFGSEAVREEMALADKYLVASSYVRKTLSEFDFPAENVIVCAYGGNFGIGEPRASAAVSAPLRLVYCGGVTPQKGVHHLISAVAGKRVSLTLVGDAFGEEGYLLERCEAEGSVNFAGKVSHDDVVRYLDEADVFVFPSLSDSFSLACAEALCRGLPVVCTDQTGASDCIIDGVNGFVVPAGDTGALADAIDWFLDNRDQIPRMSRAAIETARKLTWERYEWQIAEEFGRIGDAS